MDLKRYPKLAAHLERFRTRLEQRSTAKGKPAEWHKTIDRITPSLSYRQKLLIPDIKGSANVVFEPGQHYVHHNRYYVVSNDWDLHALRAVLLSSVAALFVAAYSVKMRGDYLRYQAQYLRRIRLPRWSSVSSQYRAALREAGLTGDRDACDRAAFALYGLTRAEIAVIAG